MFDRGKPCTRCFNCIGMINQKKPEELRLDETAKLLEYKMYKCLSVASFAIIFSHSEGCLFTLLIVSFDVQKLLILIRSHLFLFAFISNILGGGS